MAKDNNNKANQSFFGKLRNKYRLVVLNEETYEQKASLRLSRLNLFILGSLFVLFNIIAVILIIAFTPLKFMMPGVGSLDVRSELIKVELLTDSLENQIDKRNYWLNNLQQALEGKFDSSFTYSDTFSHAEKQDINLALTNDIEKEFREELKDEIELLSIETSSKNVQPNYFPLKFISPVNNATLLSEFDSKSEHFGVDLATVEGDVVKAAEDGIVVLSEWNPETGNVLAIQHRNNAITFYKHNKELLKKVGTYVKKQDAIAIVGNSGELTDGPHLHFEIWQNGKPKNPQDFINFKSIN